MSFEPGAQPMADQPDVELKVATTNTKTKASYRNACVEINCCAWVNTVIILTSLMLILVDHSYHSLVIAAWVLLIVFWIVYWFDVISSSEDTYLSNVRTKEEVYQYIKQLQQYPPEIAWEIECYHHESRTETHTIHHPAVAESGGGPNYQPAVKAYDEKVTTTRLHKIVTHYVYQEYEYDEWKDISTSLSEIEEYDLTKFQNFKTFTFANKETEIDYKRKKDEFFRTNTSDKNQTRNEYFNIKDFDDKLVLFERERGIKSGFMTMTCYYISSLLLCTTCFRMYFNSFSGKKQKYTFNKQISTKIQKIPSAPALPCYQNEIPSAPYHNEPVASQIAQVQPQQMQYYVHPATVNVIPIAPQLSVTPITQQPAKPNNQPNMEAFYYEPTINQRNN